MSVVGLDSLAHAHMRRAASPTAEASWARCWIQTSPACRSGGLITYRQPPSQGGRRPTERTADSVGLYVGRAPKANLGVLYGEIKPIGSLCVRCRMSFLDNLFLKTCLLLFYRGETGLTVEFRSECQTKRQMSIHSKTTLTGIHRVGHGGQWLLGLNRPGGQCSLALNSEGRNFLLRDPKYGPSVRSFPRMECAGCPHTFRSFPGSRAPIWSLSHDNHLIPPPTSPNFKRSSHNR